MFKYIFVALIFLCSINLTAMNESYESPFVAFIADSKPVRYFCAALISLGHMVKSCETYHAHDWHDIAYQGYLNGVNPDYPISIAVLSLASMAVPDQNRNLVASKEIAGLVCESANEPHCSYSSLFNCDYTRGHDYRNFNSLVPQDDANPLLFCRTLTEPDIIECAGLSLRDNKISVQFCYAESGRKNPFPFCQTFDFAGAPQGCYKVESYLGSTNFAPIPCKFERDVSPPKLLPAMQELTREHLCTFNLKFSTRVQEHENVVRAFIEPLISQLNIPPDLQLGCRMRPSDGKGHQMAHSEGKYNYQFYRDSLLSLASAECGITSKAGKLDGRLFGLVGHELAHLWQMVHGLMCPAADEDSILELHADIVSTLLNGNPNGLIEALFRTLLDHPEALETENLFCNNKLHYQGHEHPSFECRFLYMVEAAEFIARARESVRAHFSTK